MYEWTDHIKEDNSLIREIGALATTILWKDGEIIWTKSLRVTKPISKKKTSPTLKNSFFTMDLETVATDIGNGSTLNPYLLCWYDGLKDKSYSYFIDPSLGDIGIKDIIYRAMKDICIRKYKGYRIYLHNFSKFDAIFLIKYLVLIGSCDPVIHKGKIISFSFSPNWKKASAFGRITFYDSYLLLTSSLSKLSKSFSIDSPKILFPIFLNDINYKGSVPDIKYFKGVSPEEFKEYQNLFKDKIWDFKDESIKYCALDCKALYQVLSKFNKLIFEKFRLNLTDHPTLPSLAYSIFRSSYYKTEVIHQLSGKIDKDIRQGYTGGSTEMFIPSIIGGKKIYAYDVNSLYPSVMKDKEYPIGSPTYFEGNILKQDSKAFGFFHCKIVAPSNLLHPILQLHHKSSPNGGIRTVSPLGSWEGMYFSEELYNAEKFG